MIDSVGGVDLSVVTLDYVLNNGSTTTRSFTTGNHLPAANEVYDLGDSNTRWKDLWLSGNSIHLGNTILTADNGSLIVLNSGDSGSPPTLIDTTTFLAAFDSQAEAAGYIGSQYNYVDSANQVYNITIDLNVDGSVNTTSDISLKTNIRNIESSLEKVSQLQGVHYNRIDPETKEINPANRIGFIAQQIEPIVPEVVSTRPDGVKTVAYDDITALLVEAIKELKLEIEELKSKLGE